MRYIQARHFTPGRTTKTRLIIIHTIEGGETSGTAWSVAGWFASPDAPQASCHYAVDPSEVVGCVQPGDTAWAAPGANADGLQVEHAGMAAQTAAQWADAASTAILARSASLTRSLADRYGIPLRHLSDGQLAAGQAGFVGHAQVSRVYRRSDHTDPGPGFPWDRYMQFVAGGPQTPGDDMPTVEEIAAAAAAAVWEHAFPVTATTSETAGQRLVWASRGSAVAPVLGQILAAVQHGTPVTLSADQVKGLADAVIAQVGPAVAGQVAAELARRLAN